MGGKVFDGTSDFDHNAIEELLDDVNNKVLKGTGIECIPVGSAATPTPGKRSGSKKHKMKLASSWISLQYSLPLASFFKATAC